MGWGWGVGAKTHVLKDQIKLRVYFFIDHEFAGSPGSVVVTHDIIIFTRTKSKRL